MENARRDAFVSSIADFLKVDLRNFVSRDLLTRETEWIKDEWMLDFIKHTGTTNTGFKKPIEVFLIAIKSYKEVVYADLYKKLSSRTRELVDKLYVTLDTFSHVTPSADISFEGFVSKNTVTEEKSKTFDEKELKVLKSVGSWHYFYGRRNDRHIILQFIEKAYARSLDEYISNLGKAKETHPLLDTQAKGILQLTSDLAKQVKVEQ